MKVLITAPIFISQQVHLDFIQETLASIKTKHDFQIYLVRNYIAPEYIDAYSQLRESFGAYDVDNDIGNNVSHAWNIGIDYGLTNKFDYILIPNLDIIFHPECIDNLVGFAESRKGDNSVLWTGSEWTNRRNINTLVIKESGGRLELNTGSEKHDWEVFDEHPHFSCFMISPTTIARLGEYERNIGEPRPGFFDKGFNKAYFEDQDYHQRILNANFKALRCNKAIFYHYGSRTIKSDVQVEKENSVSYEGNRKYFETKWGYDSHGKVPTNEERVELAYDRPFNSAEPSNNK